AVEFSSVSFSHQFKLPFATQTYPAWLLKATNLTLRKDDGTSLEMHRALFAEHQDLFETAYNNTWAALGANLVEDFRMGRQIQFGEMAVSAVGLRINRGDPIPWTKIHNEFRMDGSKLEIQKKGAVFSTKHDVRRIPNFHIFLALLNEGFRRD